MTSHDWTTEELEGRALYVELIALGLCLLFFMGCAALGLWLVILGHFAGWLALMAAAVFAVLVLAIAEDLEGAR